MLLDRKEFRFMLRNICKRKIKLFFPFLLSALSLTVAAQQPTWYDDNQRMADYPSEKYFIGFSEGQRHSGENSSAALKRISDAARAEAASTIRVRVKNTTTNNGLSQTIESMSGTFYRSVEEFESKTTTSTDIQIPGLQIETWQNPSSGTIAAFAWVKKSTLIKQLEKTITVGLTKIETALDQIDQLVANGQKMQARDLALKTMPQFGEVDEAQKMLAAVDEDADEESIQLQQTRTLQHRLTELIAQLKHGINIYLSCSADMFGTNYSSLKGEIQGELSKLGCTFVNDAKQSDWAVYVKAPARQYNKHTTGNVSSYFCYVDANIVIEKTATGQRIYEDVISEKGGHTINYEQAARQAYRDISPKISKIIKEQIQQ